MDVKQEAAILAELVVDSQPDSVRVVTGASGALDGALLLPAVGSGHGLADLAEAGEQQRLSLLALVRPGVALLRGVRAADVPADPQVGVILLHRVVDLLNMGHSVVWSVVWSVLTVALFLVWPRTVGVEGPAGCQLFCCLEQSPDWSAAKKIRARRPALPIKMLSIFMGRAGLRA